MADGAAVKQFAGEMGKATSEVVKDVKDELGKAIEAGVQSAVGTQLTAQQIQQKQTEDAQKLAEARRKIEYWKKIDLEQKQVRQKKQQTQMQKQQLEEQEKQKKKMEEMRKKQAIPKPGQKLELTEDIAITRQEIGKGHGVGG